MNSIERLNNIYVIDTMMWGFEKYNSAFLVKGRELALIDTGEPNQLEAIHAELASHGFSPADISYIFVTHAEHMDHAGNVGALLKECPNASVYVSPIGEKYLTEPQNTNWGARMSKALLAKRIGPKSMEPVDPSRVKPLHDGEVFDLGDDVTLKIIVAPGHQPSGIVIWDEKNRGLFINDLVGNCFLDSGSHYALTPLGSEPELIIKALKSFKSLPLQYIYMGHYGISDEPLAIIDSTIEKYECHLEIGRECIKAGTPDLIAEKVYNAILPELEKLRAAWGEELFEYAASEHIPHHARLFTRYCQEKYGK